MPRGLRLAGLVAVVVLGGLFWWGRAPAPTPRIGMVRDTQIRLAPEISGRLGSISATPGMHVAAGDVIAELDVPELAAQIGEARAAASSAAAERTRILAGARPEDIAAAEQAVRTAEARRTLAQQVQARIAALAADDVASQSRLDDANATLAKATADMALRQAQYELAQAGPTAEERALAERQVALAEARVAELEARLAKTRILAPVSGTIGVRVAEPGEILVSGAPVATLLPDGERWFAFTLREDRLDGLEVGSEIAVVTAKGPAARARVTELRPLGEFATWRAARAVGDHDLNTLRLRLDPIAGEPQPEAGEAILLPPADPLSAAAQPQ